MQVLGENMAWILRVLDAGKEKVTEPGQQKKMRMNFIRQQT